MFIGHNLEISGVDWPVEANSEVMISLLTKIKKMRDFKVLTFWCPIEN
jgi:hypothetical protein